MESQEQAASLPGSGEPASESEPASGASGDDEVQAKAKAVSSVLDDPRSIEKGRDADGPETTRRVLLGYKLTIGQIEELQRQGKTIEIDPDGQAYEIVELPRDHAAGRPQRGVQRLEEHPDEDQPEPVPPLDRAEGKPQRGTLRQDEKDKPEPVFPVDRAEGVPQAGSPSDPDPVTIHGFRASTIAAVAFGAVQSYKARCLKQTPRVWDLLTVEDRDQITEHVRAILRGETVGPGSMHQQWAANMRERGITAEQDPRVAQAWGDLDEGERRKGYIFAQVLLSLTRNV